MLQIDLTLGLVVIVSSLGAAMLALLLMSFFQPARRINWTPIDALDETIVFLFQDRVLVDATPGARALLETGPDFLADWPRLLAVLERSFPEFPERIGTLSELQYFALRDEDNSTVEAEWRGGLARIVLHETESFRTVTAETASEKALSHELSLLQDVVNDAPMLAWKEDGTGSVCWANAAYVDLAQQLQPDGEPVGWPLPRVFSKRPVGADPAEPPRRLSARMPDGKDQWFDAYSEARGEETLVFAIPADKLVQAEASLREFVQTLTKTFAHLPTGLAVFDRERRLALFNPALTDLSALEPQFLSSRPTLFEFLDMLRQKQRAPEPKDFKIWRQQIVDLESAAASGSFQETWSLPTGQTYRVTGRPHPDGAIAFLFEDISDELSLTRQFRAELALGQSVLDGLEEAVAVFSASGSLTQFNTAYSELWTHDPHATLGDTGIVEATRLWQEACVPSPVWGDLREFASTPRERAEWSAEIRRLDGMLMTCRFVPLVGHATLVSFQPATKPDVNHTAATRVSTTMSASLT